MESFNQLPNYLGVTYLGSEEVITWLGMWRMLCPDGREGRMDGGGVQVREWS